SELSARLGVSWTNIDKGCAEIDGFAPELIRHFSKRRAEIEAAMAERGTRSRAAARTAALSTRRPKLEQLAPEGLTQRWPAEAATLGFDPQAVVRVVLGKPVPSID